MNERQAEEQGLYFTGIYSWNKEEVQKRIKEERLKRPKTRIVQVIKGRGYSAYADDKYRAYDIIEDTSRIIEDFVGNLQKAKSDYDEKVNEIKNNYEVALQRKEKAMKLLGMEE